MDSGSAADRAPIARRHRLWLVAPIVFALLYGGLLTLYAVSGRVGVEGVTAKAVPPGGVLLHIHPQMMHADTNLLDVTVDVEVADALLTEQGQGPLSADVSVVIQPAVGASVIVFPAGQPTGVHTAEIFMNDNIEDWPFDRYAAGGGAGMNVSVFQARREIPAAVDISSNTQGWRIRAAPAVVHAELSAPQAFTLTARRATSTLAFAALLLAVLITLAVLAAFVATATYRGNRKAEPGFTFWITGMLFAIVPLRNFLPGSPPAGSWVDVAVVLWVLVVLVMSLALYFVAWWQSGKQSAV